LSRQVPFCPRSLPLPDLCCLSLLCRFLPFSAFYERVFSPSHHASVSSEAEPGAAGLAARAAGVLTVSQSPACQTASRLSDSILPGMRFSTCFMEGLLNGYLTWHGAHKRPHLHRGQVGALGGLGSYFLIASSDQDQGQEFISAGASRPRRSVNYLSTSKLVTQVITDSHT